MEEIGTSLWMLLLLIPLSSSTTVGDQDPPTTLPSFHDGSSRPTVVTSPLPSSVPEETFGNCLIGTEMGLIATGSAGGLLICMMVAIVALACQVRVLQRRSYAPRTSRSNMDLVSAAGYWETDQPEAGGLVGPCDASVVLEEVGAESKTEQWQADVQNESEAVGEESEAMAGPTASDSESGCNMLTVGSRDSCLDVPRDLEDMPLVV